MPDRYGWPPYVSAAERRYRALRSAEKLRRQGRKLAPVVIQGRAIATTFWGKAWCENLESYRDYENRLPRGRTYARNGSVVDLQIGPTEVLALVSGSSLYRVRISIAGIGKSRWAAICRDCRGGIDSLVELLRGHLSGSVMKRVCHQEAGLFPTPAEIRFSCTCPDYAAMCKHVAAALYGV
ncbi:MAG: SWIM zinc finger family protein, partial [Acetobacteraceae bacterium]